MRALVVAWALERVAVDARGRLNDVASTFDKAGALADVLDQGTLGVASAFSKADMRADSVKAALKANLERFEQTAAKAQASSFAETAPIDGSTAGDFTDLKAELKREMEAFKTKVDRTIHAPLEASLLQTDPLLPAAAKLQALEARIRQQTARFQASFLEVGPDDAEEAEPAEADADEAADDKADDKADDELANEAGDETDEEKAETKTEEQAALDSEEELGKMLKKDKDDQDAMMSEIGKIGKVAAPVTQASLKRRADRIAKPSSFAQEKQLRSAFEDANGVMENFNWQSLPKGYHKFQDMVSIADQLKEPCAAAGFTLERTTATGRAGAALPDEPVVMETFTLTPKNPTRKAAAVFGEHPRELISPETGLTMLQGLCGAVPACDGCTESHDGTLAALREAAKTSAQTQWLVVLNSNPLTRKKLEESSDFCLRLDPEGVDTNRNYDDHWDSAGSADQDSHGQFPFSCPEAELLNHVLEGFRPNVFFSIHSGEKGLYTPHAWSTEHDATLPEAIALSKVPAGLIPDEYEIGSAGELQGRAITGSSFDYVKDKLGAKYSYAFELYKNANSQPYSSATCFGYFNPASPDLKTEVAQNFAAVILQTAAQST